MWARNSKPRARERRYSSSGEMQGRGKQLSASDLSGIHRRSGGKLQVKSFRASNINTSTVITSAAGAARMYNSLRQSKKTRKAVQHVGCIRLRQNSTKYVVQAKILPSIPVNGINQPTPGLHSMYIKEGKLLYTIAGAKISTCTHSLIRVATSTFHHPPEHPVHVLYICRRG